MRYEGKLYRPPSEARSYILQATIGCSHNLCTYCDMYRAKKFRVRPIKELLEDIAMAHARYGSRLEKVFVADGDALVMDMEHWEVILGSLRATFPKLRRVSCYAMARNVQEKDPKDLQRLRELGLSLLYIGPESGDAPTLKRLVKGGSFDDHVEAAEKAHAAGMEISAIVLLGAGGIKRTQEHAEASARLMTAMDPKFFSALTLTVVDNTPMQRMESKGLFELPDQDTLMRELYTLVEKSNPTDAVFRTNHASNYLPIAGQLPRDRDKILQIIDMALSGQLSMRPEWMRGL